MAGQEPREPKNYVVELAETLTSLDQLPTDSRKRLALNLAQNLPQNAKKELLNQLLPDQGTTNFIWKVVVVTFSAIALGTVLVLGIITLGGHLDSGATDAKTMLTVFTTVVGFLAGLLVPSPVTSGSK